MEKLTVQQLHSLQNTLADLNYTKDAYIKFYSKMAQHAYTVDLKNLTRGDFTRSEEVLQLKELPPLNTQPTEYTPMLIPSDKLEELYSAINEGESLL